jgi:acetoin utilization deacetylase AcuC-like enzyme
MKVFYTPKQTVLKNKSFSPSAGKPALVMESWAKLGLPIELVEPTPCTRKDIVLAHKESYVFGVLGLWLNNGFSNRLKQVADSLPWTTGSFVSAAIHAATTGETVCSPTSGFHHADYNGGMGFCTFNGLMIAAIKLKEEGHAKKVGILDIDMHYGNGTDQIIEQLGIDYIHHWTFGHDFYPYKTPGRWLVALEGIVEGFKGCDVILYQAGADPHVDDPFGGILTTEEMYQRDLIVFKTAKRLGIPIAWNLAGGYQENIRDVLDIHDNTVKAWHKVYGGGKKS